ncbi:MAG: GAD domain-containing protein [Candidatus Methanofastidiosia archaeon]
MKEITDVFANTSSGFIRKILKGGGVVIGEKIEGFYGVLPRDKRYAMALADKVKRETGAGGYISTDELPAFGISFDEKEEIESRFNLSKNDVVVFVIDREDVAKRALELIKKELLGYEG